MKVRRFSVPQLLAVVLIPALVVLIAGCSSLGGDQNTFSPAADTARDQRDLFLLALWPAIVILILVSVALIYMLVRFRRRSEDEPPPEQVHGNTRLEIAWTIAPAALLLGLAVPVIMGIVKLGGPAGEEAFPVTVIGHQWVWEFQYTSLADADGDPLVTIGTPGDPPELHLPVGREIALTLEASDVIHSFWVPKLAGHQDAVPGRENRLKFTIEEPGTYPGQCAEFCGLLHAEMKVTVIAQNNADFLAWCEEELALQPGAEACRV